MEEILGFIATYGIPVFVIATCIIAFLGILKLCKVFDKLTNRNMKKFIYYALDVILAFVGALLYFLMFHIDFSGYWMFCITQVSATTTLYAIYENFGLRKLLQMGLDKLAQAIKNSPNTKLTKTLTSLGLNETAIANIKEAVVVEAEKIKAAEATNAEVKTQ